jgi:hypothetical protein
MRTFTVAAAVGLSLIVLAGCGHSADTATSTASPAPSATVTASPVVTATEQSSPCATAVNTWDAISLPYEPAPASAENTLAQDMLRLRSATNAGNDALVEVLGKRIATDALAVLHHDLPPTCAPGLWRAARRQMLFAGIAGVGMELSNFSTAANAMKQAAVYQRQVMADEDSLTGSDNGGW